MRTLERGARRILTAGDAVATRLYGAAWNPLHQSGTIAVAMLLWLLATGVYLLLFYRLGSPSASVARIAADPWLGSWIRSLHRYATDVFIIAAAMHLLRMFAQARSWGPRTLAWVSGILLLGTGFLCAWTGFVMAWDTFGERLAREGGRLFDVLPIFSEPISRIFAGDGPVPSAFFFVNLFLHIAVPLAMGALLWIHVSRVARPQLMPPKRMTWVMAVALVTVSVIMPATLGAPASAFRIAPSTPIDLVAAWWLPLAERIDPIAAWLVIAMTATAVVFAPLLLRRPREGMWAPSVVDTRLCTGCNQCPQDCPWEAITMVARDDDRPTLVAFVNPDRCVSCGICAASCAPMGIGPPGRTGRDQLAALRRTTLPSPADSSGSPVVAICCEQAPASHLSALRERGAHVHPVRCVGNTHTSVIEWFIRQGAPGVMICACPTRDCSSREGPKWLQERLYNEREAELQERVDRRRVRVTTLAAGDLGAALADFDAFASELANLAVPLVRQDDATDVACDPVPLQGASR